MGSRSTGDAFIASATVTLGAGGVARLACPFVDVVVALPVGLAMHLVVGGGAELPLQQGPTMLAFVA